MIYMTKRFSIDPETKETLVSVGTLTVILVFIILNPFDGSNLR